LATGATTSSTTLTIGTSATNLTTSAGLTGFAGTTNTSGTTRAIAGTTTLATMSTGAIGMAARSPTTFGLATTAGKVGGRSNRAIKAYSGGRGHKGFGGHNRVVGDMDFGRFGIQTDRDTRYTRNGHECFFDGPRTTTTHHGGGNLQIRGGHDTVSDRIRGGAGAVKDEDDRGGDDSSSRFGGCRCLGWSVVGEVAVARTIQQRR
jgi:hypothetical protein